MNTNSTNYPSALFNKLKELSIEDANTTLFDYQQNVYNYMTKMNKRGILLYHAVGSGKCMAKDTPILMYNGTIKLIQDINPGDYIMGDDGNSRKIISFTTGKDKMYDVLYKDNIYTVNEEHILVLKAPSYPTLECDDNGYYIYYILNNTLLKTTFTSQSKESATIFLNSIKWEQIIEISVSNYLMLPDSVKKILKGFKAPVEFPYKQCMIDPYYIGLWLGDKCNNENVNNIYFYKELKRLNLINNKHIPMLYKCNSRKMQLKLLAGILDVASIYSKNNGFELRFNINSQMTSDIVYICNSLGLLTRVSYNNIKSRILIYGQGINDIPVLEFKKLIETKESILDGYDIEVKYKNIDNYYGFTISGNGRYLLGDFTVTHNTMTSIAIAEHFKSLNKEIIILSSKSLQANYRKEIINYNKLINGGDIVEEQLEDHLEHMRESPVKSSSIDDLDSVDDEPNVKDDIIENEVTDEIDEGLANAEEVVVEDSPVAGYKFITSNARNMINSIENKSTKRNISGIDNILEDIGRTSLENKVVIVDEAHNLFNSISNGSKLANEFYDMIMNTKNIKLIFLTGTPIINDPFEISICFNMLHGPIQTNNKKRGKKNYLTIMPEYYIDFKKFFVDQSTGNIKNEDKFKNRIYGLVSYYGDMYFEKQLSVSDDLKKTMSKENYPDRLPIKFEIIEMSQLQNVEYSKARDKEKHESSGFKGSSDDESTEVRANYFNGGAIVKDKNLASTSYRIKSRQMCNIYIDPTIKLEKFNISKYSPKLEAIFNNINKNYKEMISLVYSTFLEYGILAFAKVLELHGYKLFNETKYEEGQHYYAIYSGDQTPEERESILKKLNTEDNKHGKYISVLLISKSGTEGLDCKCIRSVHIMEPYWNFSLLQQIIARGVRYKSHIMLPEKERNVQTHIYLSDYNKDFLQNEKNKIKQRPGAKKQKSIELTTDINMFKNALRNQELIYKFLKAIASTSIECNFFNKGYNYDCFSCVPNDKKLYDEDIQTDMTISNNCMKSKKVKAEEVVINDKKFYYVKNDNGVEVYEYNSSLDGYTKTDNELAIKKIMDLAK